LTTGLLLLVITRWRNFASHPEEPRLRPPQTFAERH
jgi:hypothetical protein